jgi:hypothetical protein
MSGSDLLTRIPPEDWETTPSTVRNLVLSLLPLAAEVSELRDRVHLLEAQTGAEPEQLLKEQEQRQRVRRYHELVDTLFLKGLTSEEEAEMERLGAEIDAYNAPFYAPIRERLEAVAAKAQR